MNISTSTSCIQKSKPIACSTLAVVGIALCALAFVAYFKNWGMPSMGGFGGGGAAALSVAILIPLIAFCSNRLKKQREENEFITKVDVYCSETSDMYLSGYSPLTKHKKILALQLYRSLKESSIENFSNGLKPFAKNSDLLIEATFKEGIDVPDSSTGNHIVTIFDEILALKNNGAQCLEVLFNNLPSCSVPKLVTTENGYILREKPLPLFEIKDEKLIRLILSKVNDECLESFAKVILLRAISPWLNPLINCFSIRKLHGTKVNDLRSDLITSSFPDEEILSPYTALQTFYAGKPLENPLTYVDGAKTITLHTPLQLAIKERKDVLVDGFIKIGEKRDPVLLHSTPLSLLAYALLNIGASAEPSDQAIIETLLRAKEDPNALIPMEKIESKFQELLCEKKCPLNVPLLAYAAYRGYAEVVKILVKHGANLDAAKTFLMQGGFESAIGLIDS